MASPSTSIRARGFSLIELLLVMGLVAAMFAFGLTISFESYRTAMNRSERDVIAGLLAHARANAMANIDHTSWGVCYVAPDYIVFEGASCTGASYQEHTQGAPNITVTGLTSGSPVVFTQLSGTTSPATLATPTTITVTQGGRTSTITLTYEGAVQ